MKLLAFSNYTYFCFTLYVFIIINNASVVLIYKKEERL